MRTIMRYAGVVAIVATVAVLGGCANLNSQGTNQVTPLQTQGYNGAINVASTSPTSSLPFPQNKQNEPAVAIDPLNPAFVVAGSNDEVDLQPCSNDRSLGCPFTPGVGVSGFYFSTDGGATWTQPAYTGLTGTVASCAADVTTVDQPCVGGPGPIHTLPNYAAAGLVSDGDPALAFGPQPDSNGAFSWGNGVRLYYGNLTSNVSSARSESAFKGYEAIAVSYTDSFGKGTTTASEVPATPTWSDPVIVSKQNAALFSDKDAIWADNNSNSPYFGNVYMCNIAFRSQEISPYSLPGPVIFSRSTDGGQSWSNQQISPAANNVTGNGRQGCAVRTDSQGVVYVFYLGASRQKSQPPGSDSAILVARSYNGGRTFRPARVVQPVNECGQYSSHGNDYFFDGAAGARTDSFPSVDIANGAPDGASASDAIAVTWCDASSGADHERALVSISTDGGTHWGTPVDATATSTSTGVTDRPDFPSVAISPSGSDVYVTYMAFLVPFQGNFDNAREMQGVVRHATLNGSSLGTFNTVFRDSNIGDARASSANSLGVEFLGDYTYTAASDSGVVAVWTASPGDVCAAVDSYRMSGGSHITPPMDCALDAPNFGETNIASFSTP